MKKIIKIFELLAAEEKKRSIFIIGLLLFNALFEVLGIASILPFIAVLANPEVILENSYLNYIFVKIGLPDQNKFLLFLGFFVFIFLISSLILKAVSTYYQVRFVAMQEYRISKRLVEGYLNQPYEWFLNRNSSDIGKNILSEVGNVVNNALKPSVNLLAHISCALAILVFLLIIDIKLAITVGLIFSVSYSIIFLSIRKYLLRIGGERLKENNKRFNAVIEAFGAIKEVKANGLEGVYLKRYNRPARRFAAYQAMSIVINQVPRYALEGIAFGGMLLIILYFMTRNEDLDQVLPIITVYAVAGYRLMPAMQQIYGALTQLRFSGPALDALLNELKSFDSKKTGSHVETLYPRQKIELEKIQYFYPNSTYPVIRDVSVTIPAKSSLGIVGTTGSGKTTMADLILGLLEPSSGVIRIDDTTLTMSNSTAWRRSIGYVPQQIYIADDTVAANIAFGKDPYDIDRTAVERAGKLASIHEFIMRDLTEGYETTIGERGIRISGGQRQRIGIARALYNAPDVLVMDEGTSALDNITEASIMDAVKNLENQVTVIIIAHRVSTLIDCSQIILMDRGKIIARGTYDYLLNTSKEFRALAMQE